jgi:hypothetical protein
MELIIEENKTMLMDHNNAMDALTRVVVLLPVMVVVLVVLPVSLATMVLIPATTVQFLNHLN